MTDIAKAYVQIVPSAEGIKGAITNVLGGEAESAGSSTGLKIAQLLKKAIISAGIGKAIQQSLLEGGALQQSFEGGLGTLYGAAADQMREYAVAAAAAGISANDYAEQAVSFGAALKKSFEGAEDAELRAGEAANLAIMDMADNAAKMGTDLGSIQAAYQGFAKQNYTMLDNLKLGYGGTQKEMLRLLADAEKLTGIHYDINNLADVYQAIHVIQDDLDLSGQAAKEASGTLTGSLGAVKASLQNLMGFMSMGMDITPALTQLQTSLGDFFAKNLIPMFANIIESLPTLIASAAQMMIQGLNSISDNSGEIASFVLGMIGSIGKALIENVPALIYYGIGALGAVLHEILISAGALLDEGTTTAINFIKDKLTSYGIPEMLKKGVDMVKEIANGFISGISDVLRKIQRVIDDIKAKFKSFDWKSIGGDIIKGIANGIKNAGSLIVNAAKDAAKSAFDAAKSFLGIESPSKLFEKEVGRQISAGMAVGITKASNLVTNAIADVTSADLTGFGISGDLTAGMGYGSVGNGYTQNITINSPRELTPSEIARQTRNATRQMALQMAGVY